jgi:hypothetical protein
MMISRTVRCQVSRPGAVRDEREEIVVEARVVRIVSEAEGEEEEGGPGIVNSLDPKERFHNRDLRSTIHTIKPNRSRTSNINQHRILRPLTRIIPISPINLP